MTKKRTPPEGLLPEDKRLGLKPQESKLTPVKFSDDLEADYQAWKVGITTTTTAYAELSDPNASGT